MKFYRYVQPQNWDGYRDIDEPIDIEKIQAEQNFGDDDDEEKEEEAGGKGGSKSGTEKGSKSQASKK